MDDGQNDHGGGDLLYRSWTALPALCDDRALKKGNTTHRSLSSVRCSVRCFTQVVVGRWLRRFEEQGVRYKSTGTHARAPSHGRVGVVLGDRKEEEEEDF